MINRALIFLGIKKRKVSAPMPIVYIPGDLEIEAIRNKEDSLSRVECRMNMYIKFYRMTPEDYLAANYVLNQIKKIRNEKT